MALICVVKNDHNIKKDQLVKALVKVIAEKWDKRDREAAEKESLNKTHKS